MVGALFLLLCLFFVTIPIVRGMQVNFSTRQEQLLLRLFWYHMLFAAIYYVYVQSAASDSVAYFQRTDIDYENWWAAYTTGTHFIDFVAYPFVHYLGFNYEMMMVLFAWMGYWGFVFFYIIFQENTRFTISWYGINLVTIIIFLPNMHYWSASLGKGSLVFFGLGMAMYGLSRLKHRKIFLLLSLLLIYHIRPHVFFLMALAIVAGLLTSKEKIPAWQKLFVFAAVAVAVVFLYDDVLSFAQLDSENLMASFDQLASHRAAELAKSGSGIDISNYPLPLKLATFWFRPLFADAPGPIGIVVSFENLFYLLMAAKLCQRGFVKFMVKSSAVIKSSALVFFGISFALSGTLSNLGIIIRQKTMVMYFFLFIVIAFLDYKKQVAYHKKTGQPASKKAIEEPRLQLSPAGTA